MPTLYQYRGIFSLEQMRFQLHYMATVWSRRKPNTRSPKSNLGNPTLSQSQLPSEEVKQLNLLSQYKKKASEHAYFPSQIRQHPCLENTGHISNAVICNVATNNVNMFPSGWSLGLPDCIHDMQIASQDQEVFFPCWCLE